MIKFLLILGFILSVVGVNPHASPVVEQVTGPVQHAEEPHWDVQRQVLFFVDIFGRQVHQYDPATKTVTGLKLDGGEVSPVIPIANSNKFIVGIGRKLCEVEWNGNNATFAPKQVKVLATIDTAVGKLNNRFNDGKADTEGRIWAGTIGPEVDRVVTPNLATLYRFSKTEKSPTVVLSPVTNSNGLVWNKENDKFYYIDTPTRKIVVFDYDSDTAAICNEKVAFDLDAHNITGLPDGMTIDSDGNLWVALFLGASVIHVDPSSGQLLQRIPLPATQVSSVAFGGRNLDTLYVTTSRQGLDPKSAASQPSAGAVFAVHGLGVVGIPQNYAKW